MVAGATGNSTNQRGLYRNSTNTYHLGVRNIGDVKKLTFNDGTSMTTAVVTSDAVTNDDHAAITSNAVHDYAQPIITSTTDLPCNDVSHGYQGESKFVGYNYAIFDTTNPTATYYSCIKSFDEWYYRGLKVFVDNVHFASFQRGTSNSFRCMGDIFAASGYGSGSDDRIKSRTEPILNATDILNKLNPVTYQKHPEYMVEEGKEDSDLSGINHFKEAGLVAQDLLKVDELSYLVSEPKHEEGIFAVNYTSLIPYLIKSNQELNTRIQELERLVNLK